MVCRCVVIALVALVALVVLVAADEDKRADMSAAPFVLGSRYGRSQPRMLAPRNDRFFMGSRYGKRSWSPPDPASMLCRCTPINPVNPIPADRYRRGDEVISEADD